MLRMHRGALADAIDGLRSRDGMPFTGLAYDVPGGIVTSISRVDAGKVVGISDDWIALPAGGRRVDLDILDPGEGYGPFLLDGALFDGVAYTFEANGACTAEDTFGAGYPIEAAGRKWYPSGMPRALIDPAGFVSTWFEDGTLQYHCVGEELRYNVVVGRDGRVNCLYLQDPALFEADALRRHPLADDVRLNGAAITGTLLAALPELANVATLRLTGTSIDASDVPALTGLHGVRQLYLDGNPWLDVAVAEVLAQYDDWTVWLDGEPVAARLAG